MHEHQEYSQAFDLIIELSNHIELVTCARTASLQVCDDVFPAKPRVRPDFEVIDFAFSNPFHQSRPRDPEILSGLSGGEYLGRAGN